MREIKIPKKPDEEIDIERLGDRIINHFPGHHLDHTVTVCSSKELYISLLANYMVKKGYECRQNTHVNIDSENTKYELIIERSK
jgi:hypothetical protein